MGKLVGDMAFPSSGSQIATSIMYYFSLITIIDVTEIEINLLTTRFCKEEEVACKLMYIYHLDVEKTIN